MFTLVKSMLAATRKRRVLESQHLAVLQSDNHASSHFAYLGFIFGVSEQIGQRFMFTSLNAGGNEARLQEHVQACLRDDFRLILCLGYEATVAMQKALAAMPAAKRAQMPPVVFSDVKDPLRLGLTSSLEKVENNFIGVVETEDMSKSYVKMLLQLQPHVQNVVLVYNKNHEFGLIEEEKERVVAQLIKEGVGVAAVTASSAAEMFHKVKDCLNAAKAKPDLMITLRDTMAMQNMPLLGILAQQYGIPIFSSDLGSVTEGAALGYAYPDHLRGKKCAQKALAIIRDSAEPANMQYGILDRHGYRVRVNRTLMFMQGVKLNDEIDGWLKLYAEEIW